MNKIINALERVDPSTSQNIMELVENMDISEIIFTFNQTTGDLFDLLIKYNNKYNIINLEGYYTLFKNALKINNRLPIDQFTMIILEYAPEIYANDYDRFLNMNIPDTKVSVGNQFGIIRTDIFKSFWRQLNDTEKSKIKEKLIILTTMAHVYFYKTALQYKM